MSDQTFSLTLTRREGFQFDVSFDHPEWAPVPLDEPAPLGEGAAPNASRMLGAAIGNCLAASLLFCLEKAHVPVGDVKARVEGSIERNESGRLRIAGVKVVLEPTVEGIPRSRLARCLSLFEDFCVVTQSVRQGIDVQVEVEPVGVVEAPDEDAPA
jgi:organic hydroperoxide reductase OsmC/OhrA